MWDLKLENWDIEFRIEGLRDWDRDVKLRHWKFLLTTDNFQLAID